MDHIDEHLATSATNRVYALAIKAALAIGKRTLNRYYNQTDHSNVFRIAMGMYFIILLICYSFSYTLVVLHPRHKLEYFRNAGWEKDWVDKAEKIVRDEFDQSYGSLDASWAVQGSKSKVRRAYITLF